MNQPAAAYPSFLTDNLQKAYPNDFEKILHGFRCTRATTLRINTLKADPMTVRNRLTADRFAFLPSSFSDTALILPDVPESTLAQTELYQSGKIYLQSLSSQLPVLYLSPKEKTDILDMAAAPGGKTSQMAALCHNRAAITACEMKPIRAKRLQYNLEKLGVSCVHVMQTDSRKLPDFFAFDQILLDAPCTGSGTLGAESTLSAGFSEGLLKKCITAQKALLHKAFAVLKTGGTLLYSTCSIFREENEEAVRHLLKNPKAELLPLSSIMPDADLLPNSLPGTLTICPDARYEGFFIAAIRKNP